MAEQRKARVQLVQVSATFTFHGTCEVCGKKMRQPKSFVGVNLGAVRDQVDAHAGVKRFYCKKHRTLPVTPDA